MYTMSEEERADREKTKTLHRSIRDGMDESWGTPHHRYQLLAWGFVRGFKYRRIERSHRRQILPDGSVFEHNLPSDYLLLRALSKYVPEVTVGQVKAWLADPSGAIPAPPPRPKRRWIKSTCSECNEPVPARAEEDLPVAHAGCILKAAASSGVARPGDEVHVVLPALITAK
jgi:hypothetical protein